MVSFKLYKSFTLLFLQIMAFITMADVVHKHEDMFLQIMAFITMADVVHKHEDRKPTITLDAR